MSKETALFVGRFQPFHKGHLGVARRLAKRGKLVIAIGSSQFSRTPDNPFSYAERKRMIGLALKEARVRAVIAAVPDIGDHSKWVAWVEKHCPRFDAVYTGNAFVASLFRKAGYPVRIVRETKGISATRIRALMAKDRGWEAMLPVTVAAYIKENGLDTVVRRLRG